MLSNLARSTLHRCLKNRQHPLFTGVEANKCCSNRSVRVILTIRLPREPIISPHQWEPDGLDPFQIEGKAKGTQGNKNRRVSSHRQRENCYYPGAVTFHRRETAYPLTRCP